MSLVKFEPNIFLVDFQRAADRVSQCNLRICYVHLEIIGDTCNPVGRAIHSRNALFCLFVCLFCSKSHLFPSQ